MARLTTFIPLFVLPSYRTTLCPFLDPGLGLFKRREKSVWFCRPSKGGSLIIETHILRTGAYDTKLLLLTIKGVLEKCIASPGLEEKRNLEGKLLLDWLDEACRTLGISRQCSKQFGFESLIV